MSFQKSGSFSKIRSLPRSRFLRLVESIPELPKIGIRKRTANKETSPAAIIPKPTVSQLELRMIQDFCHGKVDITSFQEIPSLPKSNIEVRSTKSEKNDENKPKCWKMTNNGYPAYNLCTHSLPNPYQEFLKSLCLFKEGNSIYDKVLSVRQEFI